MFPISVLKTPSASGAGPLYGDFDAAVLRLSQWCIVRDDGARVAEAFDRNEVGVDAL